MVASPYDGKLDYFWTLPPRKRSAFQRHYRFTLPAAMFLITIVGGAFGHFVFESAGLIPVGAAIGFTVGVVAAVIERRMRPHTEITVKDGQLILDGARRRWACALDDLIAIDAWETSGNVQQSRLAFFHRNGDKRTVAIERDTVEDVLDTFMDLKPSLTVGFPDSTYAIPEGPDAAAGANALARGSRRLFLSCLITSLVMIGSVIARYIWLAKRGRGSSDIVIEVAIGVAGLIGLFLLINAIVVWRGWRRLQRYARHGVSDELDREASNATES